jgi:hypothetical protein
LFPSPGHAIAEFSISCPLACNQLPIVAELLNLAIEVGTLRYRTLLVRRELANVDLLSLLHDNDSARVQAEGIELDLKVAERIRAAALSR